MDNLEELAKGTPFDGLFEGDKIKPPKKSQSNSQCVSCGADKSWIAKGKCTRCGVTQSSQSELSIKYRFNLSDEQAAALLQLALSCLPEKKKSDSLYGDYGANSENSKIKGFNAAIDTIEQNIKERFS